MSKEKICITKMSIPRLELQYDILRKGGYKYAKIKDETIDNIFTQTAPDYREFDATPENIRIFEKMKSVSEKVIPLRETLIELSKQLK